MFDNSVYPGMEELLKKLKERGKTLIVATSKAQVFAEPIIEKSGLQPYFDFVAGCEVDGTRARKSEVINYALSSVGVADYSSAVMVGDTRFDILGAKEAGVANIGVLFGFGSREEFEAAGADCIAEDMPALGKLLLGC
jgi:phosphoglycolate phosphatase